MTTLRKRIEKFAHGWVAFALWILFIVCLFAFPYSGIITQKNALMGLLQTLSQLFVLITVASNWNLIGGMTGYVDFGHAVFFGIGAYVLGALVTQSGGNVLWFSPELSFFAALPFAGLGAAIFALLIGLPTLRLRGPYFSIAMLGVFVAMREITRVAKPLTGGGAGLTLPPQNALFGFPQDWFRMGEYFVMVALMGLAVSVAWWIRRSEFGQSLIAIREDEVGAEMRGINTTYHKIAIFMIASFMTGLVGAFWAWQNTFIDPDVVFFETRTIEMVMMSMLGGLGTVWGPPLGATLLYFLQDLIWANLGDVHLLVLGSTLILLVLFLPEGILGTLSDRSGTSLGRLLTGGTSSNRDESSSASSAKEVTS
ncbi:MAG: branched-chain amino acid ABC transporter permease [Chloroflexota bacterium]